MAVERAEIVLPARGRFDLEALRMHVAAIRPPFRWCDGGRSVLERAEQLPDGSVHWLRIRPARRGVALEVTGRDAREIEVLAPLAARIRRALWLDVDLREFHRLCARDPLLRAAGRSGPVLLRGTSPFEDVVGVLVSRGSPRECARDPATGLARLGRRCPARRSLRTFPEPAQLARLSLATLRAAGLDRHAVAVRALARDVVRGRRDLDAIARLPLQRAARALRGVRGLGPVGVSRVLLVLGHHDVPVLDRDARAFARRTLGGDGLAFRRWLRRQRPWRGLALHRALAGSDLSAGSAPRLTRSRRRLPRAARS